jgi:hypothetical protein
MTHVTEPRSNLIALRCVTPPIRVEQANDHLVRDFFKLLSIVILAAVGIFVAEIFWVRYKITRDDLRKANTTDTLKSH